MWSSIYSGLRAPLIYLKLDFWVGLFACCFSPPLNWADLPLPMCSSLQICLGDVMTNRVVDEVELVPATPSLWTAWFPSQSIALLSIHNHLSQSSEPRAPNLTGLVHLSSEVPTGPCQVPELSFLNRVSHWPFPKLSSPPSPPPAVVCPEGHNQWAATPAAGVAFIDCRPRCSD